MSNKLEHSNSDFYYPEEHEMAEMNANQHFDKVEASRDTGYEKLADLVLLIFVIKCHIYIYIL